MLNLLGEGINVGTELESVVSYTVKLTEIGNGTEAGVAQITGRRHGLVDFETALSDEATGEIDELIRKTTYEEQGVELTGLEYEVNYIVLKMVKEDSSSTFIAFMPDGQFLTFDFSAEENMFREIMGLTDL